jgi:hypothetical protein
MMKNNTTFNLETWKFMKEKHDRCSRYAVDRDSEKE